MENIYTIYDELSLGLIINGSIEKDLEDNSKILIEINQFPIMLVLYSNTLYSSYTKIFTNYFEDIIKLYGYSEDDAAESVGNLNKIFKQLSKTTKSTEELSEVTEAYNVITLEELKEIYSNVPNTEAFLKYYKSFDKISIADKDVAIRGNKGESFD